VLYVRSSRTGELDILLVPFTVIGIGAMHAAWSFAAEHRRTHFGAVALCGACAVGAALSKGPPALVCIGVAMVFGPMMWAGGERDGRTRARAIGAAAGALTVIVLVVLLHPVRIGDLPGLIVLEAMGALAGWTIGSVAETGGFRRWFGVMAKTHPVGVLGAAIALLWAWSWYLKGAFGAEYVAEKTAKEVGNNLNLFVAGASVKNLSFVAYGSAPIFAATVAGLVIIVRERVRLTRSMCLLLAWLIGGFIVFSIAGKGVARYLTPLWPACAMLGGWFIAQWVPRIVGEAARRRVLIAMSVVVVGAAGAQGWWYALGRSTSNDGRSVRTLAQELRRDHSGATIATWKFDEPALDLYLDSTVLVFGGESDDEGEALAAYVRERGAVLLLVRDQTERVVAKYGSAMEEIGEAGLRAREVEVSSVYLRWPDSTRVRVYEISITD